MLVKTTLLNLRIKGFTLVEMAIVLVILGLVLATLFAPLSAQRDIKNITGTQTSLSQIKEALYGFAILNSRLPCPARLIADPQDINYGLEDITLCAQEGLLPWKTLGMSETDEWGTHRTLATDPWIGYWKYRPDSNFTTSITFSNKMLMDLKTEIASNLVFADKIVVRDSSDNNLTPSTIGTEKPIAVVYSTGKNLIANGKNSIIDSTYQSDVSTADFDDILIWISRPLLVNRLVSAGKLP